MRFKKKRKLPKMIKKPQDKGMERYKSSKERKIKQTKKHQDQSRKSKEKLTSFKILRRRHARMQIPQEVSRADKERKQRNIGRRGGNQQRKKKEQVAKAKVRQVKVK